MAAGASSCLVNSCRISHFGMNPVSGGSPPSDRSIRGAKAVSAGVFAQESASVLMLVDLFNLNARNIDRVIIRYIIKVSRVREGKKGRIRAIQPRWAIEEYARIFRS